MPAPRLGFVQQTMWPWEETIEQAAEYGFDHVELLMDGDHDRTALDPIAAEIRATAADLGVDLLVHLPFRLDVGSPQEHVREGSVRELEAAIETAGAFGAKKGVVHAHSRAWPAVWDRETVQGHLLDSIRRLDDHGRECGVEVCVENLKGDWLTLDEFPLLLDATDASVTLDTGHARKEGHDAAAIAAFAREHADRISHVHVNETIEQLEHIPIGAGDLDFAAVLGALFDGADGDWTGTLSIEVFTPNFDYVRASRDNLRDVLAAIDG